MAGNLAVIGKVNCFESGHLHIDVSFVPSFCFERSGRSGLELPMVIRMTAQGCKHTTMSALFTGFEE